MKEDSKTNGIIVEDLPNDVPKPVESPEAAARKDAVSHLAIKDRFNIDNPTQQEEKKLAEIWAYASRIAESEDINDIIWEVIHLEGVLGAPRLGESRLDRLYRYAKLRKQESVIKQELKEVARNV